MIFRETIELDFICLVQTCRTGILKINIIIIINRYDC